MRSRLSVTLRSRLWRKLSTLLSRPVVAVELPLGAVRRAAERADVERPELLRRDEGRDVLFGLAELLADELRAVVFFAEAVLLADDFFADEDFLAVEDFFAVDDFAVCFFELLALPVFFVFLPALLFELPRELDFWVAMPRLLVAFAGTISFRQGEVTLYRSVVGESHRAPVLAHLAAPGRPRLGGAGGFEVAGEEMVDGPLAVR